MYEKLIVNYHFFNTKKNPAQLRTGLNFLIVSFNYLYIRRVLLSQS